MENRFREDLRLGTLIARVDLLIEAITRRDRWQIARNATGPLLKELLAGHYDHRFEAADQVGIPGPEGAPIAVADDRVAVVVGAFQSSPETSPVPVTAVLVARAHPHRWLVAALDFEMIADGTFQRRVQFGTFSEEEDLAVIAAHGTLDTEAAAIDWDDPAAVLRDNGVTKVTVADVIPELAKFSRAGWAMIAEENVELSAGYLRARHPELVREYPKP